MATDKEVERAQTVVAKLREKLADSHAKSTPDSEAQNDIYMEQLAREAEELQRQIDEVESVKKFQHPDAANPLAYAQSTLVRDEIVPDKPSDKSTSNASGTTSATDKSKG